MAEIVHHDPETQETWIPSSGQPPPYWAWKTLEGQLHAHRHRLIEDVLGNEIPDTGFFYCPYIPVMKTPVVLDPEIFKRNKGILTRYGKKLLEEGKKYYGKISF